MTEETKEPQFTLRVAKHKLGLGKTFQASDCNGIVVCRGVIRGGRACFDKGSAPTRAISRRLAFEATLPGMPTGAQLEEFAKIEAETEAHREAKKASPSASPKKAPARKRPRDHTMGKPAPVKSDTPDAKKGSDK